MSRLRNDLKCVEWDVKPYTTNQSIGNNSGLCTSWGFRELRIEWCDRHLCHVTGSDHAHLFGVKQHFECV